MFLSILISCQIIKLYLTIRNFEWTIVYFYYNIFIVLLDQPETDAIRGDHYSRLLDTYGCLGVLQSCPSKFFVHLYLIVMSVFFENDV